MSMKNIDGFTFIEITLVILLIGLLAATVVPIYYDLKSDARDCTIDQIATAMSTAASLGYLKSAANGDSPPVYPATSDLKNNLHISDPELNWVESGNCATVDIDGYGYSFLYNQSDGTITVENGKGSCKPAKKKK